MTTRTHRTILLAILCFIAVAPALHAASEPTIDARIASAQASLSDEDFSAGCDRELAVMHSERDMAQTAASVGLWMEAIRTFDALLQRLQETSSPCPPDRTTQIATLSSDIANRKAAAEQGMHRGLCIPAMDRALSLDTRAAALQADKKDWAEIERLFRQAEASWHEAESVCQGSSREAAKANRTDSARARAKAASYLGDGGPCERALEDAVRLGDLAKLAWTEKHWEEAGMWNRKASTAWGAAAEKCQDPKRSQALRKKEHAMVDAHNAVNCAPLWEDANSSSIRLKALPRDATPEQKSDLRDRTEIAWRDAAAACRGSSGEKAKANAELLAKERGSTPLPRSSPERLATGLVQPAGSTQSTTDNPASNATRPPQASPPTQDPNSADQERGRQASIPTVGVNVASPDRPVALSSGQASPVAPSPVQNKPQPDTEGRLQVATTIYIGQFRIDPATGIVSGTGRVEWNNGDVFEGTLVNGKSEGHGTMTWKKSGNRYVGPWVNDVQHGQGLMIFSGGSRYEGQYRHGKMSGTGKYFYGDSGDQYEGELLDGKPEGKGTYHWKSGDRYKGDWRQGARHGLGRFTWTDGSYWEGRFENNRQTDDGVMVFAKRESPG